MNINETNLMNAVALHPPRLKSTWRHVLMMLQLIFALAMAIGLNTSPLYAAPAPANAVIGNQASATYVDSTGTVRPVTSNTVQTTVLQVKSFILTQTGAKTVPAGQQVCLERRKKSDTMNWRVKG